MHKFTAYLDDSGSHRESERYVVAGYLAKREAWVALDEPWGATLNRWGIDWMHMKDAESGHGSFGALSIESRHQCISEFADLVASHAEHAVVATFSHAEFRRSVLPELVSDLQISQVSGEPYSLALAWSIEALAQLCEQHGVECAQVAIVLAKQERGGLALANTAGLRRKHGFADPRFDDPRTCLPLQAADMFAWRVHRSHGGKDLPFPTRHVALRKPGVKMMASSRDMSDLALMAARLREEYPPQSSPPN